MVSDQMIKNVNTIGEKMDTSIEKQNLLHSKLEKEEDILEKFVSVSKMELR